MINQACHREDSGEYKCVLKNGQLDSNIYGALGYIFSEQKLTNQTDTKSYFNLTGSALDAAASPLIEKFFDEYRHTGVTCDFGGIAMLIERNKTISKDDYNDDFYYTYVDKGPALWILVLSGICLALSAGLTGFVVAMRYSPNFNRRVRSTALFMPLTKSSNSLLRSSLALPALGSEYEELVKGFDEGGKPFARNLSSGSAGPLSW